MTDSGGLGNARFRASLNITMGVLYLVLGGAVIALQHFGTLELGQGTSIALGSLMLLYGAFRIWRGSQDLKMLRSNRNS